MSKEPRDASVAEIRSVLQEGLPPKSTVRLTRQHDGGLMLAVLSEAFSESEEPRALIDSLLSNQGLKLPARTLTFLKAPDELEAGEEEAFKRPALGTPTWADALLREPEPSAAADDRGFGCPVVAFWGLKGGVGRSTALAHVAAILGKRGGKVLAIDLDLDSPGLVATLAGEDAARSKSRFEDLVRLAATNSVTDDELEHRILECLHPASVGAASVEVLGPPAADVEFVRNLIGPLAPSALYRGGSPALRRLIRLTIKVSNADIALVDARSGYCDESAMTVLDLADQVVVFVSPSPSVFVSLAPALEAFERSKLSLGRPSQLHFVAGMLPAGEEARKHILNELTEVVDTSREQIENVLRTPPERLPPDPSIITVDYSPRIVENEGIIQLNVSEGYREIAERIDPRPTPLPVTPLPTDFVSTIVKNAKIPVAQAESEEELDALTRLFTSTPQLEQFARHDVCLVLGAKGTGKTYLRRICLEHKQTLLDRTRIQSLAKVLFVDGYSNPRQGRAAMPPVNMDLLNELDKKAGDRWSYIWSAIALGRTLARIRDERGNLDGLKLEGAVGQAIIRLSEADTSKQVLPLVQKVIKKPMELDELWRQVDEFNEKTGQTTTLLFDDLDVALGEAPEAIERRNKLILGLLDRANASWIARRHLGVKIFLREDIFRSLKTEEEAKYATRSVILAWRPEDIWRLVIRAFAVASAKFNEVLQQRVRDPERLEEAREEDWLPVLALIWGERMGGGGESNTRSTNWARARLRDGTDRMFPRAALWLLKYGLEERKRQGIPNSPPLLDAGSLRSAMPEVSRQRLTELRRECTAREKDLLNKIKGFDSYMDEEKFRNRLKKAGVAESAEALKTLEALGLVERGARRNGTPTVRIVDLYALAEELEINRIGRR